MTAKGQQLELKELIAKISSLELPEIDIKELCSPCPSIGIEEFISHLQAAQRQSKSKIIIDVRSEAEFEEAHIPGATNFPIFNNKERHNVGLLFKQKSEKLAEQVGAYYAFNKAEEYVNEIKKAAAGKEILVHCWRGGYRSKSVTALLVKNGLQAKRLDGGIKAFRKVVLHYLYKYDLDLVALSGQTGTGKSEILETMAQENDIPVLHLEGAAQHASSVFGPVRFGCNPVNKQQEFETRIFMQLLPWLHNRTLPQFITEKESPKIGRLVLPPSIQKALNKEVHIRLNCSLDERVKRLKREYIDHLDSTNKAYLRERLTYLKRTISGETLQQYLELYDQENWDILLKRILVEYYDIVYKKTDTEPIFEINNHSNSKTISIIKGILTKEATA